MPNSHLIFVSKRNPWGQEQPGNILSLIAANQHKQNQIQNSLELKFSFTFVPWKKLFHVQKWLHTDLV